MELFTSLEGVQLLTRWVHFLAGVTWIGLLYYFNFVQGPFFNATSPEVKTAATRGLVPRALWWFRYSALVTWLAGVLLILIIVAQQDWNFGEVLTRPFPQGLPILTGAVLGTIMFLNVWGVIWPKQKIVIASAEAAATGGQADPRATDATRRALLASRTNVLFSIPMLFFMATSSHLALAGSATTGQKALYIILAAVVIGAVEANALAGTTGPAKQPLEKVQSTIVSGFVLWLVLWLLLVLILP
ncbi:MAG: urate hydroxylase PuuD [Actinomycetota bacterium]|nr:urate hydroxylase PuuD [Actinomycetota bacterium]